MAFITPDQALAHIRSDEMGTVESLYLEAAQDNAIQYLNRQVYATQADLDAAKSAGTAGDSPIVVNDSIRAATLLIFGHLYATREAVFIGSGTAVEIPFGAWTLLQPYRAAMGV